LAELVGRTGQTYEAMVPSLFNQGSFVFNHRLWMDTNGIYLENEQMPQDYANSMKTMRELTAWRLKHGDVIQ
jgi:arylsulfatase